jgi:NADH:ubiquinone oxidoreductase subunit 2 (subunit N)
MYMREPGEAAESLPPLAGGLGVTVWSAAIATLVLGVCPWLVLDFAGRAALR